MKKLIFVFYFFFMGIFPIHANVTTTTCVEMMKLHYTWINQKKCDRAARQLESTEKVCRKFLNNKYDRMEIERLVLKDESLIDLYEVLLDKNKNPQSICPARKTS